MLECSVYGVLTKKLNKGIKFQKTEQVYSDGIRTGIIVKNLESGKEEIIIKETPDRNKQRISIVQKITKIKTNNSVLFLHTLGFDFLTFNNIEGYLYNRNGYNIEISKLKPVEETVDSSDENNFCDEIPEDFLKYYLVKVYVETENITEGEKMLEKAFQELNGEIELIKPNLNVF